MKEAYFLHMIESRAASPSSIPGSENFLEPPSYRNEPDAPTRAELDNEEEEEEGEADTTRHVPSMEDLDTPPVSSGVRSTQHIEPDAEEAPPKTLRPGEYSHDRFFAHQAPTPEDLPLPVNHSLRWARESRETEWRDRHDKWESRRDLAADRGETFTEPAPPAPPWIRQQEEDSIASNAPTLSQPRNPDQDAA